MKKIITLLVILAPALWIGGCSHDPGLAETKVSIDQILGDKQVAVHRGMLAFRDKAALAKLEADLLDKDKDFISTWEKSVGFKSLYSVYEDVIEAEEAFLSEMTEKYGASSEIARTEIGYSALAKQYIDKGAIIINDDEILDMNVTFRSLAPLVNSDGFIRVGNEIFQYKTEFVKVILDADYDKIDGLGEIDESTPYVHVGEVTRTRSKISDVARTQALSKCEDVEGSHRLIGYEEMVTATEGGFPCPTYRNDYYIQARSLKKILGTWQNFKTSQFRFSGEVTVDHLNCDLSYNRNVTSGSYASGSYSGEYHTYNFYLILRYDTGPCVSSTSTCSGTGYLIFRSGATRTHTVSGVNGTTCTMP